MTIAEGKKRGNLLPTVQRPNATTDKWSATQHAARVSKSSLPPSHSHVDVVDGRYPLAFVEKSRRLTLSIILGRRPESSPCTTQDASNALSRFRTVNIQVREKTKSRWAAAAGANVVEESGLVA